MPHIKAGRYLGIILLAFLLVISLSTLAAQKVNQPTPKQEAHQTTAENSPTLTAPEHNGSAEERIAEYTWWLTFFTAALVISTIALWLTAFSDGRKRDKDTKVSLDIANRHAEDVRAQLAIAEIHARAATKAADSAINLEFPILHIEEITAANSYAKDNGAWIRHFTPKLTIKNYGRTPAFVSEVLINVEIAKALPDPPSYQTIITIPDDFVVEEKGKYLWTDYLMKRAIRFSDADILTLTATDKAYFFIYGYIKYTDIWGNSHRYGFIYTWNVGTDSITPVSPKTYPHYSYRRQEA